MCYLCRWYQSCIKRLTASKMKKLKQREWSRRKRRRPEVVSVTYSIWMSRSSFLEVWFTQRYKTHEKTMKNCVKVQLLQAGLCFSFSQQKLIWLPDSSLVTQTKRSSFSGHDQLFLFQVFSDCCNVPDLSYGSLSCSLAHDLKQVHLEKTRLETSQGH